MMNPSVSPLGCVVCLHKGLLPGVQLSEVSPAGTLRKTCLVWLGKADCPTISLSSSTVLAKTSSVGCYRAGMFSGKERNSMRKIRDKEIKDRGKSCCFVLSKGCAIHRGENGKMKVWP